MKKQIPGDCFRFEAPTTRGMHHPAGCEIRNECFQRESSTPFSIQRGGVPCPVDGVVDGRAAGFRVYFTLAYAFSVEVSPTFLA